MTMQADSRHTEKTGVHRGHASPGRAVAWRDVLGALQSDNGRSAALASYRAAGHTADSFATSRHARRAMAEALTRTEDALESANGRLTGERLALRAVRRTLECEACS